MEVPPQPLLEVEEAKLVGGEFNFSSEERSETVNELATALSIAQGQIVNAVKDTRGFNYNYADLAQVINVAKEPLSKNGLSVVQTTTFTKNGTRVLVTTLMHKSGQFLRSYFPFSVDASMKGNTYMQRLGSSMTYARRYAYAAMVGIAQEDDDAAPFTRKSVSKGNYGTI